jgi:hypothetical protein
MKRYTDSAELIIDLHQKGFTQDFQLKGNDLYWLNENRQVNIGEFIVVEFHKIIDDNGQYSRSIVLGIVALHHDIKGILLRRCKSQSFVLPPVLLKKLNGLEVEGLSWGNINSYRHQIIHE